jgi:hypothetical protein
MMDSFVKSRKINHRFKPFACTIDLMLGCLLLLNGQALVLGTGHFLATREDMKTDHHRILANCTVFHVKSSLMSFCTSMLAPCLPDLIAHELLTKTCLIRQAPNQPPERHLHAAISIRIERIFHVRKTIHYKFACAPSRAASRSTSYMKSKYGLSK